MVVGDHIGSMSVRRSRVIVEGKERGGTRATITAVDEKRKEAGEQSCGIAVECDNPGSKGQIYKVGDRFMVTHGICYCISFPMHAATGKRWKVHLHLYLEYIIQCSRCIDDGGTLYIQLVYWT